MLPKILITNYHKGDIRIRFISFNDIDVLIVKVVTKAHEKAH